MDNSCNEQVTREIPAEMKRTIRKRCGFGCVVCGHPIYEYHHMIEWSIVKEHKEEEITLLCDNHHKQVHKNLLPTSIVRKFNSKPYNLDRGESSPMPLYFQGSLFKVIIGNNEYIADDSPEPIFNEKVPSCLLMIDMVPIIYIKFEDDQILLTIKLYDKNNKLVLRIIDNELIYSTGHWDITFIKNRLTLLEGKRQITLGIEFSPPSQVHVYNGKIFLNGLELNITRHDLKIVNYNGVVRDNHIRRSKIGLYIGIEPHPGLMGAAFTIIYTDLTRRHKVNNWIPPFTE
jgi:hypothetical protein